MCRALPAGHKSAARARYWNDGPRHPTEGETLAPRWIAWRRQICSWQNFEQELSLPFIGSNREIEELSGMPVTEVMAPYSQEGCRRLERQALERIATFFAKVSRSIVDGCQNYIVISMI